ncbi:hypothetical protein B1T49_22095 [Mycobacterium persicum]|nr:hypothetical protein B1T49_22095 [Mycobacterium persicum]
MGSDSTGDRLTFANNLNDQSGDIIAATDSLNDLVGKFAAQQPVSDRAIKTLPEAVAALNDPWKPSAPDRWTPERTRSWPPTR